MNPFVKKGYGRIYVMDRSKIKRVAEIVKEVDPDEFECYFPRAGDPLIVSWPEDGVVRLIYTYKYEACMDAITARCWREGIAVWCISQRDESFSEGNGLS
jgi:hypothetical protein